MDLLWRGPDFRDNQYASFTFYSPEKEAQSPERVLQDVENITWPATVAIQYEPTITKPEYEKQTHSKVLTTGQDWGTYLNQLPLANSATNGPTASIMCETPLNYSNGPRSRLNSILPSFPPYGDLPLGSHNAVKLRQLPVEEETFKNMVSKLHIHQALHIILNRGAHSICRISYSTGTLENAGIPCVSYILRTSVALSPDHALSITYFPTAKRLYALFLGYENTHVETVHQRLEFAGKATLQPFALINIFLEIEKKHHFRLVNDHNYNMLALVGNLVVSSTDIIDIYKDVLFLRDQLEQWKAEILSFREHMGDDFPKDMPDPLDATGKKQLPLLEPREYLDRLVREYDARSRVCEGILGTGGLAFQVETANIARMETAKMKAIAVLTMVFLPATFVCTFLSMGVFDWQANTNPIPVPSQDSSPEAERILSPLWWIFFPMSGGLTAIVLYLYYYGTNLKRISIGMRSLVRSASSLVRPKREKAERSRV
ncbi:hypothetical protein OQA88_8723 [Cercophora sp. LCS_1]